MIKLRKGNTIDLVNLNSLTDPDGMVDIRDAMKLYFDTHDWMVDTKIEDPQGWCGRYLNTIYKLMGSWSLPKSSVAIMLATILTHMTEEATVNSAAER